MPSVISMKRNDLGVAWGFRLQGGKDFRIPLSIKKVTSDSPAGISGLSDGDIILQINGVPATEITHQQGINMIKAAQLELNLVAESTDVRYVLKKPSELVKEWRQDCQDMRTMIEELKQS